MIKDRHELFGEVASPDPAYPCVGCQYYLGKKKIFHDSDDMYYWGGRGGTEGVPGFVAGWYCENCLRKFRVYNYGKSESLGEQLFMEKAMLCQQYHENRLIDMPVATIQQVAEKLKTEGPTT